MTAINAGEGCNMKRKEQPLAVQGLTDKAMDAKSVSGYIEKVN